MVQLNSDVTSVNLVFVSDKTINNSDNLRIKCLSYSKISAILSVLYFLFLHFFITSCHVMSTNVRKLCFLVIFDTCDVLYNWSISLLPPIVLDNLFATIINFQLLTESIKGTVDVINSRMTCQIHNGAL